jgi:methylenetetrahydrofolate reductase (NADPH)
MAEPFTLRERSSRQPCGRLEQLVRAKLFAVTAETTPPVSAAPERLLAQTAPLKGVADAVNVTDGAGAKAHMSNVAAAALMVQAGIEPVLQLTTRDRNLIALQSALLGAAAVGVRNVLCLRGDDIATGDQPQATQVHDLDSRGLLGLARTMRDEGRLPSGRAIADPPPLFLGAADAPAEPGPDWTPAPVEAKIAAGAQFFQTQFCFDLDMVRRYMARLGDAGVLEHARYLIGIGPLRSAGSARWMNHHLWGVDIPEPIIARLEGARDAPAEGVRICVELIEGLHEIPGVVGAHLMGPRCEEAAAEAIRLSGVLERRAAATAPAS